MPRPPTASPTPATPLRPRRPYRGGQPGKQDRLIAFAAKRYDRHAIDLGRLPPIARQLAAEVGLHPGTARRVLRTHVRALQNGHSTGPNDMLLAEAAPVFAPGARYRWPTCCWPCPRWRAPACWNGSRCLRPTP